MKKALKIVQYCWITLILTYVIVIVRVCVIYVEKDTTPPADDTLLFFEDDIILSNVDSDDIDSMVREVYAYAKTIRDDCYISYASFYDYLNNSKEEYSKYIHIAFSFKCKSDKLPKGTIYTNIKIADTVTFDIGVYRSEYQYTILKDAEVNMERLLKDRKAIYEKVKKDHKSRENEMKLMEINFWNASKANLKIITSVGNYNDEYQKFAGMWFEYDAFWKFVLYGSLSLLAGLSVAWIVLKIVIVYRRRKSNSE